MVIPHLSSSFGLVEALVRLDVVHALGCILKPPRALRGDRVELGHVGLDVEHWSSVEEIEAGHPEDRARDREQSNY
jgi:hypothetical protein